MLRIAITGHRPNKLGGYAPNNPMRLAVIDFFRRLAMPGVSFISGMALGVDQWAAEGLTRAKAPWTAAIPCKGQDGFWHAASRADYARLLKCASRVHYVSTLPYRPKLMWERNHWMVDNSDLLVGIWDGDLSGGTASCIRYARSVERETVIVRPSELLSEYKVSERRSKGS